MRFSLLLVTALLLFTATSALAAPKLMVPESDFNFGSIVQGDKLNHVFPIENNGDSPLNIQRLSASCGCTAANASAPVIQPGKKGEIKVTFDSANFTGKVTKNVVIETNDPKTPAYTLTLTGNIIEEIQVNPRQLNLGQIKAGVPATSVVTITNKGNRTLRVLSAKAQIPQITAEIKKNQLKAGESGVIEVTITPKTTDRILSGYLTIVTDSPRKSEIVVPVYGSPAK